MTKREELVAKLLSKGYRFATEAEYDAFFMEFVASERDKKIKETRIEGIVETKREFGFGLDVFIVPTWFQMIGA